MPPGSSPGYGLEPDSELVDAVASIARAVADRVGRTDPRRVRQADRARPARQPGCGSWSTPDSPTSSSPSSRRCASSRTRSTATRTCWRTRSRWSRTSGDDAPGEFDFRLTRLAALFHDVGKPRTRGYRKGNGVTFHHHDVVGARMTKERMTALRYSTDDIARRRRTGRSPPPVPHLQDGLDRLGGAPLRARCRPAARRAERAHPLRLHHPQRAQGARAVAADGRAGGADRRARRGARSSTRSAPSSTGER